MAHNSSTNGNSWTILAPEVKESGVQSLGLLSEDQVEPQAEPALTQSTVLLDTLTEQTHPADSPQVTPLESSEDAAVLHSTSENENMASSLPAYVETLTSLTPDPGGQGAPGDSAASQPLIETESFSDSYTHISPQPGASDNAEVLSQGQEKEELSKTLKEGCKPEEKVNEGDGLRRRNISVLHPSYHRGGEEEEEEEGEEEQFRHPQREGDIGFTLNKCIFGALILLGLGTIFFSGVLMDLDDEGDTEVKDLKYPEVKKEWLKSDAQGETHGVVQPPEIMDELAKETQQVTSLHVQFQEQEVQLKTTQVEDGTQERLGREELEAENQRMKEELDKLPALQKEYEQENERARRERERVNKELEALSTMQKELECLKDQVTELTKSTVHVQAVMPSAGHEVITSSPEKKAKNDKKPREKEKKEKDNKTIKNELKKDKNVKVDEHAMGKSTKDHKELVMEEDKQGRHKEVRKNKQKENKQDDAPKWKLDGGKRELKEKTGKGKWNEDKWQKGKHKEIVHKKMDQQKEDKEWKQKDWKEENEWKKGKQASQNDQEWKEKSDRKKDWKARKEWADKKETGASSEEKYHEKSQKEKTRKGKKDDHTGNREKKERGEKHQGGKEKHKPKSGKRVEEWTEEKKQTNKNRRKEDKINRKAKHQQMHHSYSGPKHRKDHMHINYWAEQREKIRHYYGSTEGCADVTSCAHAEGIAPVSERDFEAFITDYLTKLPGNEDQTFEKEELSKLISEFFTGGVYVHDEIPFREFVEDLRDILEDMAEGDKGIEDEMEGFAKEAMEKFALQEKVVNEEKIGGSGRKRMKV